MEENREVKKELGRSLANSVDAAFIETSWTEFWNINEAFDIAFKDAYWKKLKIML